MIVNSLCNSCFQPYILVLQHSDVELVKQVADETGRTCPCPRLCGGRINLIGDFQIKEMTEKMRLRDPIGITGMQLFKAVNGIGLPDEIPTSKLTLTALLLHRKIASVETELIDGKLYLHEIVFEGEYEADPPTRIHLASGQRGALVLKITQDPAYEDASNGS